MWSEETALEELGLRACDIPGPTEASWSRNTHFREGSAGRYSCVVSNTAGSHHRDVQLVVQPGAETKGEGAEASCGFEG